MKTFIKIIILLLLLIAIGGVITYTVRKEDVHHSIRTFFEDELSRMLDNPVSVGEVRYIPMHSVSLERVTVTDKNTPGLILADINNITVTPDVKTILTEKQLSAIIDIEGLSAPDILLNATCRLRSKKSENFKGVFSPSLIESVFILDGQLGIKNLIARDLSGIIKIENEALSSGKIRFTSGGTDYFMTLMPLENNPKGLDISLRSEHLGLECESLIDKDIFTITSLKGMFYTVRFDLAGELNKFYSPTEITGSLEGTFKSELSTLSTLGGEMGEFARKNTLEGPVIIKNSVINIKTDNIKNWTAQGDFEALDVVAGGIYVANLTTPVLLEDGRIDAPSVNGSFYAGKLTGSFKMDLLEEDLPFLLRLEVSEVDYGMFMKDFAEDTTGVYGILNGDLDLNGYLTDTSSIKGHGSVTISDADLGEMPIITPLLGDLYMNFQDLFLETSTTGEISAAYADFDIVDRRIITNDLTFIGKQIYITSTGWIDFDGRLNFVFENKFLAETPAEDEDWQIALRDSIIHVGKFLKKAKLKGTVSNPEWGL